MQEKIINVFFSNQEKGYIPLKRQTTPTKIYFIFEAITAVKKCRYSTIRASNVFKQIHHLFISYG